jgi:hypothetical protein
MKNVQRKLRTGEYENAVSLLRAARYVSFGLSKYGVLIRRFPFADLTTFVLFFHLVL